MHESSIIAGGAVGGLLLAAAVDKLVAVLRRWIHGDPTAAVFFSPRGGCEKALVAELATARHELLVMAYSFTNVEVARAIIAAAGRGVSVAVLLDRSNEAESRSEIGDLKEHKIDLRIDAEHAIAHNKVMVIDGRTVITGSFNFTKQAEHENAENLLILRDHRELAIRYRDNFFAHRSHCRAPGERVVVSHARRYAAV